MKYAAELTEDDGMFYSKNKSAISYPESGNNEYFNIEENSFWFKHRNNCIVSAVKQYYPNGVIFDIGGGNGYVAKGLEDSGIEIVLLEPGLAGCLNAKRRNLKNIIYSSLEDAKFASDSIPAVGLFDVLEHTENDIKFLEIIYSYLQDNGLIFITVPAYKALWSSEDIEAKHYRRYSISSLAERLNKTGFKIEYTTYLFSILPLVIFIFRTLPNRLGLAKGNKHTCEHKERKGFIGFLLNKIWQFELKTINQGKILPFGSSCFLVARKTAMKE